MTAFVWTWFWIHVFGAIVGIIGLAVIPYPRTKTETRGMAAASVLASIAWAIWAWVALH